MVEVHDTDDNVEFHAVTSAFVAVAVRLDFEHFNVTENLFDTDPEPRKGRVVDFSLSIQWLIFGCFIRKIGILMHFFDTLIARAGCLVEVFFRHMYDAPLPRHADFRFQCVVLFLARNVRVLAPLRSFYGLFGRVDNEAFNLFL